MQSHLVRRVLVGAVLGAVVAVAAPATASAQIGFVAQGQYGTDYEAIGLGGGLQFDLGSFGESTGFELETTFDYFFPDNIDVWELNGNLRLHLDAPRGLYVGGGLSYAHASHDGPGGNDGGDLRLNALAGLEFAPRGSVRPFLQARLAFLDGSQFYFGGGVRF